MSVLVKATFARLTAAAEVWESRVYRVPMMGSDDRPIVYPYVVCTLVGGGQINERPAKRYFELLWQIRAVDKDSERAYAAGLRINELMFDSDFTGANKLDQNHADWQISAVSEEETVDIPQQIESEILYHVGSVYRVVMQEN